MSISPSLVIFSVQLATIKSNTLSITVAIKNKENKTVEIPALIDSGAGGILSKLGMSELRSAGRDCGVNFAELRTRPQLIGCALT